MYVFSPTIMYIYTHVVFYLFLGAFFPLFVVQFVNFGGKTDKNAKVIISAKLKKKRQKRPYIPIQDGVLIMGTCILCSNTGEYNVHNVYIYIQI